MNYGTTSTDLYFQTGAVFLLENNVKPALGAPVSFSDSKFLLQPLIGSNKFIMNITVVHLT